MILSENERPLIDPSATGERIRQLRLERGLSVADVQEAFGFYEPQAIYRWQSGRTLPSVNHLYRLSLLFKVTMEDILVPYESAADEKTNNSEKQQEAPAAFDFMCPLLYTCQVGRGRHVLRVPG